MASLELSLRCALALLLLVALFECAYALTRRTDSAAIVTSEEQYQIQETARADDQLSSAASPEARRRTGHNHKYLKRKKKSKKHHKKHLRRFSPVTKDPKAEINDDNNAIDVASKPATSVSNTHDVPMYRRIYNPDELVRINDAPFMAAVTLNQELWCAGAIIDGDKILTAAHCLQLQYNNRFFREYVKILGVRVGSSNATAGGELLRVTDIFFHPNYKPQTLEFNFAVIRISKNLTFGQDEPVAMLPVSRDDFIPINNNISFLGWGSVSADGGPGAQVLLQRVVLPIYDNSDCQEIYGKDLVTKNNFCAGYITIPENLCNHDAGGPAIMGGRLVGILSFSNKRCDEEDRPAVFATVGAVAKWLDTVGQYNAKNGTLRRLS